MKPSSIVIREVMLRDGLQNIPQFIPTAAKIELFRLIAASGVRNMEITSFVSPKAIPQFRDAAQMVQAVLKMKPEGLEVSCLVPNLKGAEGALENGMRKLGFFMSVSESHNISNVRRTRSESIDELKKILELRGKYPDMDVKVGMPCVFGCPFEGKIKPEVTLGYVRQFYQLGLRDMSIADTVGFGEIAALSRCLARLYLLGDLFIQNFRLRAQYAK